MQPALGPWGQPFNHISRPETEPGLLVHNPDSTVKTLTHAAPLNPPKPPWTKLSHLLLWRCCFLRCGGEEGTLTSKNSRREGSRLIFWLAIYPQPLLRVSAGPFCLPLMVHSHRPQACCILIRFGVINPKMTPGIVCIQDHAVFSLQENAIGDEGASAVASALKANTALTAL